MDIEVILVHHRIGGLVERLRTDGSDERVRRRVNPASDALAATIGMGVLMVYGGFTVLAAVIVGDAITGTFGKFPENCVTC